MNNGNKVCCSLTLFAELLNLEEKLHSLSWLSMLGTMVGIFLKSQTGSRPLLLSVIRPQKMILWFFLEAFQLSISPLARLFLRGSSMVLGAICHLPAWKHWQFTAFRVVPRPWPLGMFCFDSVVCFRRRLNPFFDLFHKVTLSQKEQGMHRASSNLFACRWTIWLIFFKWVETTN